MKLLFSGQWMQQKNITLSEVSQAPKVTYFPTYVEELACKINVHINTYMILYTYIHILHNHTHIHIEKNMIVLVDLS
jgi:hypothetical protein